MHHLKELSYVQTAISGMPTGRKILKAVMPSILRSCFLMGSFGASYEWLHASCMLPVLGQSSPSIAFSTEFTGCKMHLRYTCLSIFRTFLHACTEDRQ